MSDVILVGRGSAILEVPADSWHNYLAQAHQHSSPRLRFMTQEHHQVRNFVVSALPRNDDKPLSPHVIATRLQLPLASVIAILNDLQRHLFFLVQNEAGEVDWAFPVTVEQTPHSLSFSTGEHIFAA